MISIYNSVESPIKDIEILGNTVDGVSVGILQDDGQYKITLFTNNGLDNMSPDYREDKEELLLPCQLEKIGDSTDRLYYDKEEKAWCIYKVGQSKIVLPITFTISLNSFYGTTNLYMVSGEVEGTIKAKVSKSLGASVSSLNDKADVLIDKIDAMLGGRVDLDGYATIEYVDVKDGEIKNLLEENKTEIEANKTSILSLENELSKTENTKYTTENGVKEFSCKDGYVDNVVIEGETLVNLVDFDVSRANSDGITIRTYFKSANRVSNGTYTLFNNNDKEMFFVTSKISTGEYVEGYTVLPNTPYLLELDSDRQCYGIDFGITSVGWVDDPSWYTHSNVKAIILEGDHTGKPISYFEGLKSVGQGDKIEVLSYKKQIESNLFNGSYRNGSYDSNGVFYADNNGTANANDINISGKKTLIIKNNSDLASAYCIYDSNTKLLVRQSFVGVATIDLPPNATYINFFIGTNNVGYNPSIQTEIYEVKYDKKQILTTLRSLPNGVKDTIEKRGNKYYKIKRCGEIVLNGSEDWFKVGAIVQANTVQFGFKKGNDVAYKGDSEVFFYCDKIPPTEERNWQEDREFIFINPNDYIISISKTRLSTQDVAGFKTWLKSNPVTVVYELATPIIEELPNFNPQTFSDKTTLLLNSGVVQGEADFEVTNSLGSELEALKNKVSDNDDTLLLKSDKGHYHSCDENMVTLWKGSLNATSGDIALTDSVLNYKALIVNVGNVGGGKNTSLTIYPFNLGSRQEPHGKIRVTEEMYVTLFAGTTPYKYYFKPSNTPNNLYFEIRNSSNVVISSNPDSQLFNIRYIVGVK